MQNKRHLHLHYFSWKSHSSWKISQDFFLNFFFSCFALLPSLIPSLGCSTCRGNQEPPGPCVVLLVLSSDFMAVMLPVMCMTLVAQVDLNKLIYFFFWTENLFFSLASCLDDTLPKDFTTVVF